MNVRRVAPQVHVNVRGAGVARRVGNRFLGDAQQLALDRGGDGAEMPGRDVEARRRADGPASDLGDRALEPAHFQHR